MTPEEAKEKRQGLSHSMFKLAYGSSLDGIQALYLEECDKWAESLSERPKHPNRQMKTLAAALPYV